MIIDTITLDEIRSMPTVIDTHHESCLRAYNILEVVKEQLASGTDPKFISQIIDMLETPIPIIENHYYYVKSDSRTNLTHTVIRRANVWSCSCEDYRLNGNTKCKHIRKIVEGTKDGD